MDTDEFAVQLADAGVGAVVPFALLSGERHGDQAEAEGCDRAIGDGAGEPVARDHLAEVRPEHVLDALVGALVGGRQCQPQRELVTERRAPRRGAVPVGLVGDEDAGGPRRQVDRHRGRRVGGGHEDLAGEQVVVVSTAEPPEPVTGQGGAQLA